MQVFFDSSAFVKRYIGGPGTDEVLTWCNKAREISLSGIALPEIISAFCRLLGEQKISGTQYALLKSSLLVDIEDITLCNLTPAVLAQTVLSLEQNVLRGMDAIHVASAVALKADVFVSVDKRQCEAAVKAGLRVELV